MQQSEMQLSALSDFEEFFSRSGIKTKTHVS